MTADGDAGVHLAHAWSLWEEERIDEVVAECRVALAAAPGLAGAHELLGCALSQLGDHERALASMERAIELDPDSVRAHCNFAFELLATGDYARGWEELEWRWRRPEYQTLRRMVPGSWWDGGDPAGRTILLFAEQALGDAIQFVRYAPLVAARSACVVVDCHPQLKGLLGHVEGVTRVVENDAELPSFELCSPLISVARLLGTRYDSVPAKVPYIVATPEHARRWRERMAAPARSLRVGLVWACNPGSPQAWRRSVQPDLFAPLARIPGVTCYSLQIGTPGMDSVAGGGLQLTDMTEELYDFRDTAGFVSNLDLVISVDTVFAHLAGAMGRAVWTLLSRNPDWRWGLEGATTPWYPTMRLFRQQSDGDWESVGWQLEAELRALAGRART